MSCVRVEDPWNPGNEAYQCTVDGAILPTLASCEQYLLDLQLPPWEPGMNGTIIEDPLGDLTDDTPTGGVSGCLLAHFVPVPTFLRWVRRNIKPYFPFRKQYYAMSRLLLRVE